MTPYFETENGKLYHGNAKDVMPELEQVDMTLTSPPYDNLRDYEGYEFDFEGIAKGLYRITKPGGVVVWVVGDETKNGSESGTSFRQALYFKELGFNLHDTMIYQKTGFANPSNNRYHQIFEYMFVFSLGSPKSFNPIIDRKNRYSKAGGRCKRQKTGETKGGIGGQPLKFYGQRYNIWEIISVGKANTKHPATFPEALPYDHICSWSNEGDTILDPMAGSGITLKMAEKLGRKWIGIEISEKYCEIAAKRIEAETKQFKLPMVGV